MHPKVHFFKNPVLCFLAGVMTVLAWACGPAGASASQQQVIINQIDITRFPEIVLYVSVQGADGRLVQGLGAADFKVREDEVEQSPIAVAAQLPPMSTVLVVDSSGSMNKAMRDAQRAAVTYIDRAKADDEFLVIDFDDTVKVVQEFTTDKQKLRNAIRTMKARGNTALYDAIFEATQSFKERQERRGIIALTDGKDDDGANRPLSVKTVEEVVSAANEVNVPVFTIGLGSNVDESVLEKIASATGGQYFRSPSSAELGSLYQEIGSQLEGQYLLSYTTSLADPDGSWHNVVVAFAENTGLKKYKAPLKEAAAPARQPAPEPKSQEPGPVENVLSEKQGAVVLYATSQYNDTDWAARNLIDGKIGKGHEYATQGKKSPQEILFELPRAALVSELIIDPFTTESENTWVRDGELWVSTDGPYEGFSKVTAFTLNNKRLVSEDPAYSLTEQSFTFDPVPARWIKLVLLTNYGGNYFELGEVKLMGGVMDAATQGPALVNVLSIKNGGKFIYTTSQYNDTDWAARNLIDGKLGKGFEYATSSKDPADAVFALPQVTTITEVAFNPFVTESPSNWVREVEVQVSTTHPKNGYSSVGTFTLHNRQNVDPAKPLPDQRFQITPVKAKFVKLRLLSNYGGNYIEMGEFKAYAKQE